ncbi:PPE family protein, SVP subgroup [Mycobacterium nebraskense]|uniref:PPE family protein, SVP subgroup n=1 Tax=Mycobacterium nebraskense TaxID=244292 RepID=UPI000617FF5C|nr:PPE domain-containing protein [Mycobacterium nebraskense]KKC06070.1 PPE family protein [Mycobacterium nebraskense]
MDFAALPPELNSARMYTGPGAAPMLAAATTWDALAVALHSAATSYQSEVAALTGGPWLGPSAAAMAAAAAPYVAWTRTAAAQAEQTANQAKAAAAAYEAAFAETVPPPVIAANRTLLMSLVATNVFGQNTPAIATTEAQYSEMWAQDAGAMYGYAASSAAATRLTPFAPPQQSTDSGGSVRQAAALTQATGTSAGKVQSALTSTQQAFSATPNALTSLATPLDFGFGGRDLLGLAADLSAVFVDPEIGTAGLAAAVVALPYDVAGALTGFHTDDIVSGWAGVQSWPGTAPVPPTPFPVITNLAGGTAATAGLGQANMVGGLSVPPGWAAAAPAVRPAALGLPATTVGAAAQASSTGSGSLFGEMAAASMAGRAMAGTTGAGVAGRAERLRASTKKPAQDSAAAPQVPAGGPITSIAAELRELASLRDAGIITEEEFLEQKQRLLPH